MPPKKAPSGGEGYDPSEFLRSYKKAMRELMFEDDVAQKTVTAAMGDLEEEPMPVAFNFTGRLGPSATRCVRHALLGSGPGLNASAFPYRPLTTLMFSGCDLQDGGASHVAEILKPSAANARGKGVELTSLTITQDNLSKAGYEALSVGLAANTLLTELKLDYNPTLDDTATRVLCAGLWMKLNLSTLSLQFCNVGPLGAGHLAKFLAQPGVRLQKLDLEGNPLMPEGLGALSRGIRGTNTLETLSLRSTGIGHPYSISEWEQAMPRVDDAWREFLAAIQANSKSAEAPLSMLDLRDNNLEIPPLDLDSMVLTEGAETPLPAINWPDRIESEVLAAPDCKITSLLVDITIHNYEKLHRISGAGGKKGGKKGKKGKKKKKK